MNDAELELFERQARRDYFAAAALTGLCANSDAPFHENVAKQAWIIADMMLAQEEKP